MNSLNNQKDATAAAGAPVFFRRPDALSLDEAAYYQDLLYRDIRIGTEIEFALPKGVMRRDFQPVLEQRLQPSRDMNNLGRLGIFNVIKEHSGIEIQVIGRHPNWDALVGQYRQIVNILLEAGVRIRPTCGLHFHMLGIGISEGIPEIIAANLWNLVRKYSPGLKFLTSGGDSRRTLTRRRQHNAHQEIMGLSPANNSMWQIKERLKRSRVVPEHQNFLNLEHLAPRDDGMIADFHLEFRFPDGDLSPASIAAKTFLFFIILLKAVEISKFGLLHVGRVGEWKRKKELMDLISNNDGPLACSDTSAVTDDVLEEYRVNARLLLKELKSIFLILDTPAELVLQSLAERPVSLRRIEGNGWEKIDGDLKRLIPPSMIKDDLDLKITKIIELGLVEGSRSPMEWLRMAAVMSGASLDMLKTRIESFKSRAPTWNESMGSMVFLR